MGILREKSKYLLLHIEHLFLEFILGVGHLLQLLVVRVQLDLRRLDLGAQSLHFGPQLGLLRRRLVQGHLSVKARALLLDFVELS